MRVPESEHTAEPGVLLPRQEQGSLIEAIRGKYRRLELCGQVGVPGALQPTWVAFGPDKTVSDPSVLSKLSLPLQTKVLFYVEYPHPGHVRRATLSDVLGYFRKRQIWERVDTYILPIDLSWCLAYTHEDREGVDLLVLAGDVPVEDG